MNKIISFVLLGALLLMCFSGCVTLGNKNIGDKGNNAQSLNEGNNTSNNINESNDDENSTDNKNDNNVDYIIVGTDPQSDTMSQYAISVEIPEKFSLSETYVPISVSYGLLDGTDVNRDSYTDIILKAENKNGHKVILDTLNIEEILKSDYTVKRIWDDNQEWVVGFDYSYTESYMLPLSLFSSDSGQIYISLDECNSADLDGLLGAGAYIVLYYTRNESSISISAEPIR